MRPRIARRIVHRVTEGTATALSYNRMQVVMAFAQARVPLTPELLQPWEDAPNPRAAANKARIEEARLRDAENVQEIVAIAAGLAAFQQAMDNEVVEVPDQITLEQNGEVVSRISLDEVQDRLEAMTVRELRAQAKAWDLSGYSKMKKSDLITLLLADERS